MTDCGKQVRFVYLSAWRLRGVRWVPWYILWFLWYLNAESTATPACHSQRKVVDACTTAPYCYAPILCRLFFKLVNCPAPTQCGLSYVLQKQAMHPSSIMAMEVTIPPLSGMLHEWLAVMYLICTSWKRKPSSLALRRRSIIEIIQGLGDRKQAHISIAG